VAVAVVAVLLEERVQLVQRLVRTGKRGNE